MDYESSTMFFYLSRFLHIDAYFGYILINFRSLQKWCSGQICLLSGAIYLQLKRNIEKKYGRIVVVTYSHTHARGAECRRHEERGAAGTEGVGVWGGGITSPMGYGSAERDFLEKVFFCWKRSLFLEEVYFVGGGVFFLEEVFFCWRR